MTNQYSHTNSKGMTYYLYSTTVTLRGGKEQTIYFFRKRADDEYTPCELPVDREVIENPRNGFLVIRKKRTE